MTLRGQTIKVLVHVSLFDEDDDDEDFPDWRGRVAATNDNTCNVLPEREFNGSIQKQSKEITQR